MNQQQSANDMNQERGKKQEYIVPAEFPAIEPRNIEERFVHVLERNMKGNKSNTRYMCKVCMEQCMRVPDLIYGE